jgi:DNA-directed RNA polymerase sigma subunit (sigma70/sigma32)
LGLSRERTRQIESFALRKLRKVLCPEASDHRSMASSGIQALLAMEKPR